MSYTQYGYGDAATWPEFSGDCNDPRHPGFDCDEEQEQYEHFYDVMRSDLLTADGRERIADDLHNMEYKGKSLMQLVTDALAADSATGWARLQDALEDFLVLEYIKND